jgi:hypothetical protein
MELGEIQEGHVKTPGRELDNRLASQVRALSGKCPENK